MWKSGWYPAQPGPVVTLYEIEPAVGVKGSQIVALAKDLARSLSLLSVRVVETIPGKILWVWSCRIQEEKLFDSRKYLFQ